MIGSIIDCFELKDRSALEYGAAGVVVIFRHDPKAAAPAAGEPVLLVRSDGWLYRGTAEDIRSEPTAQATGLFLRNLKKEDVPVGSELRWGSDVPSLTSAVA